MFGFIKVFYPEYTTTLQLLKIEIFKNYQIFALSSKN